MSDQPVIPSLTFAALAVQDLHPDPARPRRKRGDATQKDLNASLEQHGMLQTILVRKEDGKVIIVSGERRWIGATELGWPTVQCLITTATSQQALVLQLIENVHREDLAAEDIAAHLQALISQVQTEDAKATTRALATMVGKSVGWVSEKMALTKLCDEVKSLKENNTVKNSRVLIGLSKLKEENPEAAGALIKEIEDGKSVSVDLINEVRGHQRQKKASTKEEVTVKDLPSAVQDAIHVAAEAKAVAETTPAEQSAPARPAASVTAIDKPRRKPKVVEVAKMIGVSADLPPDELLEAFAEAYSRLLDQKMQAAA